MSYLKKPFGNAIYTALLFASYVTGIPNGDAKDAAYGLADVALFNIDAIRSSGPEWYRQEMQLFAYFHTGKRWSKTVIAWTIDEYPTHATRESVDGAISYAFQKWSAKIPRQFEQVLPNEEPDITVSFESIGNAVWLSMIAYHSRALLLDNSRVTLVINDQINWTDKNQNDWCNLHIVALHEIGHALGLADTDIPATVMYHQQRRHAKKTDLVLDSDDIEGIQALYGSRTDTHPKSGLSTPNATPS